ncbi:MAG: hypothetical protein QUV07_01240 [Cyanobium sp. CZS 25K]|nr:hypothetical protein [Cyanobium sp. CZS25K]
MKASSAKMIVVSGLFVTGRRPLLTPLVAIGGLLAALGTASVLAQHEGHGAQQAVFATKAEAEAAARHFHCTGAHKMGNQWMPCASHGEATGGISSPAGH